MKLFRPTILLAAEIRADLNSKLQPRYVAAAMDSFLRAARLRQSILKRAFEGKRVQQDPHDEPATVLLERIRSQRAGEPGKLDESLAHKPVKDGSGRRKRTIHRS